MENISVVISGFDPYDGVEVNPALIMPDTLAAEGIPVDANDLDDPLHNVNLTIHAVHMPVSFGKAWPILNDTLNRVHPNIVIATGLKRNARSILLERCAINVKDMTRADADNVIPSHSFISETGPAAYWTGLPLRAILNAFARDDIPASLSSDAGIFVCNALFYHLQSWAVQQECTMTGFVNLPPVVAQEHSQRGLTMEQQITAGRDLVREAVRYYCAPRTPDMLLPGDELGTSLLKTLRSM